MKTRTVCKEARFVIGSPRTTERRATGRTCWGSFLGLPETGGNCHPWCTDDADAPRLVAERPRCVFIGEEVEVRSTNCEHRVHEAIGVPRAILMTTLGGSDNSFCASRCLQGRAGHRRAVHPRVGVLALRRRRFRWQPIRRFRRGRRLGQLRRQQRVGRVVELGGKRLGRNARGRRIDWFWRRPDRRRHRHGRLRFWWINWFGWQRHGRRRIGRSGRKQRHGRNSGDHRHRRSGRHGRCRRPSERWKRWRRRDGG